MAMQPSSSRTPVRGRLDRVRALVSDERGVSLVLAMLVVAALSITTAGLARLVTSNEHAFGRDRQEARAFNVAEAGLNEGVSYLSTLDSSTQQSYALNSTIPSGAPSSTKSYSLDTGSGTWWAQKTAVSTAVDTWTVHAEATVGNVTRQVSLDVAANKTTVAQPVSGVWAKGFYVADPTYCTYLNGTTTLKLNTYVAGSLCLTGTQQIVDPTPASPSLALYVGGQVQISGSQATIGTGSGAGQRILEANIVGGCLRSGVPKTCSIGSQSHVYANSYIQSAQTLTKPPVDASGIYASGDWNNPVCSTGSFTFDNNGTRNSSVGTVDLLSGPSYSCTVYKDSSHVAGNEEGTLTWNAALKKLTISGTLYIDGNLAFAGGDIATYTGTGVIYVNGTVSISGNSAFCGPGDSLIGSSPYGCTGTWNPDASTGGGAIGVVAVNSGGTTGITSGLCTPTAAWSMSGNAQLDILAYVNGCFQESGTSFVTGPVTTDQAVVAGTPTHTNVPSPPPDMPGAASTTTVSSWGYVVPGSWRQIPG
jgi:Tfp pilus assembly protein PilX